MSSSVNLSKPFCYLISALPSLALPRSTKNSSHHKPHTAQILQLPQWANWQSEGAGGFTKPGTANRTKNFKGVLVWGCSDSRGHRTALVI
ncbi:hypothetical protein K443DRAFT_681632 [Laccaria amethystina LaAM-08-1]|uniref:Uncharacterized protein n=1 Tax=Laccaria amethystina LaAM-08-1 TaxID=1095629 RepID=A0A0C9X7F4_9AGAR|nr:hypothetical protein K443DRAFT_681632 [Laccaria amethystina LaAM-08-1]